MRILLTNDDGIYAEGIYTLARELEKENEVIIVAPKEEHSGQSQAITISESIEVEEVKLEGLESEAYSVTGTPADCVKIAEEIIDMDSIDMIITGINKGLNIGMATLYSGTVSAAIEGNIHNKFSLATSAAMKDGKCNFKLATDLTMEILGKIKKEGFPKKDMVLSLNTPYSETGEYRGLKVIDLNREMLFKFEKEEEIDGIRKYRLVGKKEDNPDRKGDLAEIIKGYATLTPLKYNFTDYNMLDQLDEWLNRR